MVGDCAERGKDRCAVGLAVIRRPNITIRWRLRGPGQSSRIVRSGSVLPGTQSAIAAATRKVSGAIVGGRRRIDPSGQIATGSWRSRLVGPRACLQQLGHVFGAKPAVALGATTGGARADEHRLVDRACELPRQPPAREPAAAVLTQAAGAPAA